MTYTIYDPATGQILYTITLGTADISDPNLQGKTFIEGKYSGKEYYIDAGTPVAIPQDPSTSTGRYDFDYTTKTWILNTTKSQQAARAMRNELLAQVDRVNPVWYASLTTIQQQQLQAYRQGLLDITDQAGFPDSVIWPIKPVWL